jgi:hypothetical protein
LSEKIREIIQQLKEKLFEVAEIKQLREKFYNMDTTVMRKAKQLGDPYKCVTKTLLVELKNIKLALVNSAKDIEKIFKKPFESLFTKVTLLLPH